MKIKTILKMWFIVVPLGLAATVFYAAGAITTHDFERFMASFNSYVRR